MATIYRVYLTIEEEVEEEEVFTKLYDSPIGLFESEEDALEFVNQIEQEL